MTVRHLKRLEETRRIKASWWTEEFDAVVVASGHYWVPYVPHIDGLEELERSRPGSVVHSKHFRGRDALKGKVRIHIPIF